MWCPRDWKYGLREWAAAKFLALTDFLSNSRLLELKCDQILGLKTIFFLILRLWNANFEKFVIYGKNRVKLEELKISETGVLWSSQEGMTRVSWGWHIPVTYLQVFQGLFNNSHTRIYYMVYKRKYPLLCASNLCSSVYSSHIDCKNQISQAEVIVAFQ